MKAGRIFVLVTLLISMFTGIFLLAGETIFMVKKIEINMNFDLDRAKLAGYLQLTPVRAIWKYNSNSIIRKIDTMYFVDKKEIIKRYPDRIIVNLSLKKPIAYIKSKDGISLTDKDGLVFQNIALANRYMPVILSEDNTLISNGKILSAGYKVLTELLNKLKLVNSAAYSSISEVKVAENKSGGFDYLVKIRDNDEYIHLRNTINTDDIIKSVAFVRYNNYKNMFNGMVSYNRNCFFVKETIR